MTISCIYAIKNKLNDVIYVGSAVNVALRWTKHKYDLNSNSHRNKYLQAAWNKYGKTSFNFFILERVSDLSKLLEKEQSWINWINCIAPKGYNLSPTAGSTYGLKFKHKNKRIFKPHSEERKLKIGLAQKGRKYSDETIALMRIAKTGKRVSEVTKLKLSNANKGKIVSADVRLKISVGNKGKIVSDTAKEKIRAAALRQWQRQQEPLVLIGTPLMLG